MKVKLENKLEEKDLYVISPNAEILKEAHKHSNKVFKQAVNNGDFFREELEKILYDRGIWTEEKEKNLNELDKLINSKVKAINTGKLDSKKLKLSEGRKLALEVRNLRFARTILMSERNKLDNTTVEGQSDDARFDYLVYACLVDEEGNRIFNDVDDYINNSESAHAREGALILASLVHNLDPKWEENLPENKFLKKYNLVNEEGRLINKSGQYVNFDNQKVNENGQLINEDGLPVDEEGNVIVESSVESAEFEDDL